MTGSIRYLSKETFQIYSKHITEICEGFAKSLSCEVRVIVKEEYPPVINNQKSTELIQKIGEKLLGKDSCYEFPHP